MLPESSRMIITFGFTSPLVPEASGLSARSTVAPQAIGASASESARKRRDSLTTSCSSNQNPTIACTMLSVLRGPTTRVVTR